MLIFCIALCPMRYEHGLRTVLNTTCLVFPAETDLEMCQTLGLQNLILNNTYSIHSDFKYKRYIYIYIYIHDKLRLSSINLISDSKNDMKKKEKGRKRYMKLC